MISKLEYGISTKENDYLLFFIIVIMLELFNFIINYLGF